jgi:hypothetical protein
MPQLCDNTYRQSLGESLSQVLHAHGVELGKLPVSPARQFLHIVSPFSVGTNSQAERIQALTFAAMQQSVNFIEANNKGNTARPNVRFRSAVMPQDMTFSMRFFPDTVSLSRSIMDVGAFQVPRALPLLFDLIEAALVEDVDTVIFTNVDIIPLPHFYSAVSKLFECGFDALVINRRTIDGEFDDPSLLPLLLADYGRPHEGHDCFVFNVKAARQFIRTSACVGAGAVMRGLIYNMVAQATRMLILTDVHLTCHIGDDKTWASPDLQDYVHHNKNEAIALLRKLIAANPERFNAFRDAFPRPGTQLT